ncbi:MAG: hypothetical protein RI883_742 [Bacteroidota bacterium]
MKPSELHIENEKLLQQINLLEEENSRLKKEMEFSSIKQTVIVPVEFKPIFDIAEKNVASYFSDVYNSAENGEIEISGERYVLIRSAALSYEFLDIIKELYKDTGDEEAVRIGNNFLFDIGHVLGMKDAKAFHDKMNLVDPIQKLSAGPVHFAYTGWANVEILPESNPVTDESFLLKYHHHNSFEAQAWKKAKKVSDKPVCIMNSGYSSGWCEESYGIPLTAVEISCEACGDEHCTFIMAPTSKIGEYLNEIKIEGTSEEYDVPTFFKRKETEDKLHESLLQKETLLKEVHHRVKNNLQIISSLFKLQLNTIEDEELNNIFLTSLNRVNTMAQIHELIYSDDNLSSINIEKYIEHLMSSLKQLYHKPGKDILIALNFDLTETNFVPDKAIPLGLILNEIISNAFKYAQNENPVFTLNLKNDEHFYYLSFSDNGPGLPTVLAQNTLGLALISILSEQIDAELKSESTKNGLTYTIKFIK